MNKIILLDSIDLSKKQQTVRLKKIYNITLLTCVPHDVENIIHDYVHDIIEVRITYGRNRYYFFVEDQYIDCNLISFSFQYCISDNIPEKIECSNNIATISIHGRSYPYSALANEYMKRYYSQQSYFNNIKFYNKHYKNCMTTIRVSGNTLSYYDDYDLMDMFAPIPSILTCIARMQINNHKLFKNMIVMIKCIILPLHGR